MALASLATLAAGAYLPYPPHPGIQLAAVVLAVALFPFHRLLRAPVLLALAVLTGVAPGAAPALAATVYASASRRGPRRRRIRAPAGAGAAVVGAATLMAPWLGPGSMVYGAAQGVVLTATAVVVPGLVGTVRGQQSRLVRALRERGDASERARQLAASEARIYERSRIAAEMHDLLGHRLSLISLHTGGLEMALGGAAPELREEAALVRRTTGVAMRELRQALGVLGPLGRDTGPDALTDTTGLRADIQALVEDSRAGGVHVRLEWKGSDLLDRSPQLRRTVHRVVREALTNVHHHAVTAYTTVTVVHADTTVTVTVRNGAPTLPATPGPGTGTGRGLAGLKARTELLGGTFSALPLPAGGFQVQATLPAEPVEVGAGAQEDTLPRDIPDAPQLPQDAAPPHPTVRWLTAACGITALWASTPLGIGFIYAAQPTGDNTPPPPPRIGMTYEQVAGSGVLDNHAVRAAATGHEPPRPETAVGCIYPFNGTTEIGPGRLTIARYCFDTTRHLITIDRFSVPSVQDGTPWETP
ncbi:histidine kinase [Streptomyces sp. NPDC126514]|uniref:histidine kinase n=1 Tax=Streptomyces sp. NPDC126514 TaxID=3155210 RepID=UPI00332B99FD